MRKAKVFMSGNSQMVRLPRDLQFSSSEVLIEKKGTPIENNDLWIVVHAIALRVVLITNNVKEFRRIPGLKVDNWVTSSD